MPDSKDVNHSHMPSEKDFPVPQKTIDPVTNMNFDQQIAGAEAEPTPNSSHTAIRIFSRDKDDLVYKR